MVGLGTLRGSTAGEAEAGLAMPVQHSVFRPPSRLRRFGGTAFACVPRKLALNWKLDGKYNGTVRVLLVSTYDMGRQPFGLASPAAWLSEAGADVRCLDLTREKLQDDAFQAADVVGFFLPMHTATRLALPVI